MNSRYIRNQILLTQNYFLISRLDNFSFKILYKTKSGRYRLIFTFLTCTSISESLIIFNQLGIFLGRVKLK